MLGLMQDWPLLIQKIIDFAALQHPRREVVSRLVEGPIHRTNYSELRGRALKVASRRSPGTTTAISRRGTASPVSARSITRSIRGCSPNRSPGS